MHSVQTMRWLYVTLLGLTGVLVSQQVRAYEPFLGEIRWVTFNFAPKNWALCNGQYLSINQNQALFSLLGTTYGGNGTTTFALPDLRGRGPIHVGGGHVIGAQVGAETHTLTHAEMPSDTHALQVDSREATASAPTTTRYLAKTSTGTSAYGSTSSPGAALSASAISTVGGNQPHENMKPFIAMTCIISLQGIFPSQN